MEEALKLRKKAKDAFCRSRKELGLIQDGSRFEMNLRDLALEKGKSRLAKFQRRQLRLLNTVTSVIKHASVGNQIPDVASLCEKQNLDPIQYDIAVEITQLFNSVVIKPSSKLRSYVEKNAHSKLGSFAKNLILNIVAQPIEMFINAGNIVLTAYLKSDEPSEQRQRLRISAIRILMHLSDCFRYRFDYKTAQKIAELILFSDSSDPEAYMRMAMNAALATDFAQDLAPFFHYCMFLDNRNVLIEHAEAKVVHRTAILMFLDAVWVLLTGDKKEASGKLRDENLWKALTDFVKEATGKDVLYMIGAFMFSHYRATVDPKSNGENHPSWGLAGYALSRFVTVLAEAVAEKLKEVKTMVRNRKRNRRRAIQKKRKKDPNHFSGDGAEVIAFEAFQYIGPIEERVPHLGALSFMTHYWSSREIPIDQPTDIHTVATALRSLQAVVSELRCICELTSTLSLSEHLEHEALKKSRALPPLFEDVLFRNLSLCEKLGLFEDVRVSGAAFESLFRGEPNLKEVIGSYATATYESIVQANATRYMRAFSLRCARESKVNADGLGLVATTSVVTTVIRKLRISNLISELEKFGGGRIARLLIQAPEIGEAERLDFDQEGSLSPPLPGQTPFPGSQNLQDEQKIDDIDALLTKRRRLIGSFTPGHSKAQYTMYNEGESDSPALGSRSFSNGHREVHQGKEREERHTKRKEPTGKAGTGHLIGISKQLAGLRSRIRRPMDDGNDDARDQPSTEPSTKRSTEEHKSTTLRLLQLMYPTHTNSVPHLCCKNRDDQHWRRPSSEPPYVDVATFRGLAARNVKSRHTH